MADKKVNPRLVWTVSILLALLFGAAGVLLLWRPDQFPRPLLAGEEAYVLYRQGLGVLYLLGAVLLVVPRTSWIGALAEAVLLLGFIAYEAFQGRYNNAVIPALFLVSLGTLAYIRRPGAQEPASPSTPAAPPTADGPPTP